MPKEIANKTEKEIYIKCKKCADEIFGDTRKKMTYCKCKTIGVDGCEDYVRVIGDKGLMIFDIQKIRDFICWKKRLDRKRDPNKGAPKL